MATTYSPGLMRVPSAMGDLTSLFGMGRGEHPRNNHHKEVIRCGEDDNSTALHLKIMYILRKQPS